MTKTVGRPRKVSVVGKGFKFGFGFMMAYAIYQIVANIVKAAFVIIAGLMGSHMFM